MTPPPTRLDAYAFDRYSQNGEDGILDRIFELLEVTDGWCVEFGAVDGVHLSNTHHQIKERGWRAVLIEPDLREFAKLTVNMSEFEGVTCVNSFVRFEPPDDLDGILATTQIPHDFALLSIDVDGIDYHIWDSLTRYRPRVVVIEINPTMPNHVAFVQARDPTVRHGSSLQAVVNLGTQKGYSLVATTTSNAIFVRDELFSRLGVTDNSLDTLRPGHEHETSILHLYDGTLVLAGRTRHPWNGLELRNSRIQILPRLLRAYSPEASPRIRKLERLWHWLYKNRP